MMKKRLVILLIFFLLACWIILSISKPGDLRIHFMDVGRGDAILIQTPKGKTALVDTGDLINGYRVVEYLKSNGIRSIDYLILTHPDLDHMGGAFFVMQMLKVKQVCDNGQDLSKISRYSDVHHLYGQLIRRRKNYRPLKARDHFYLSGVDFKVLWPGRPFDPSGFNPNSLVVMLEYRGFRSLLVGDLTIPSEEKLLESGEDLKADLLKVGHHGINDASSQEFLDAVSPGMIIISVKEPETGSYPSEELMGRLRGLGSKVYRTDKDGDIIFSVNSNGKITVKTKKSVQVRKQLI